jgi:serine/threonine protein kinase
MSEPPSGPKGPAEKQESAPFLAAPPVADAAGSPPVANAPGSDRPLAGARGSSREGSEGVLDPGPPFSDEAPTVISRGLPKPVRPEEAFSHTLRGRKLAHFELIEPIGVGGMAAVIRARDTLLDRIVALKILPPEMAANPENIQRFHQEARAAAKLDHENIARVFFCGEDQGLHFISFEFVEGDNLRTILERRGPLAVPEAVNYLLQIATGLAHAAGRGVVHRDIKPSNIIITPTGRAKLVDMGLARSMEPHHDLALTQSGVTLGTFDYISPEQALEPREADVRSDIYSLGCTFYHLLTGKPPVPEGTAAKKLHHHQNVGPIDPRQLNPAIPDEVAAILARMMAKDCNDRYQRPEHLVQHLLQQAHQLGAIAEVPEGVLFMDTPLPRPPRLRPALQIVAAAIVLVAFIILEGIFAPAGPSGRRRDEETAKRGQEKIAVATPPVRGDGASQNPDPAEEATKQSAKPPDTNARRQVDSKNGRDLARILRQQDTDLNVFLANDVFDLNQERGMARELPGLVIQGRGRQIIIQPKDATKRPIIRLMYEADIVAGVRDVLAAVTIKGATVVLKNLRFEIDATLAPGILMAAVRLQDGGQLTLDRCEFIQTGPGKEGRLSAVLVEGPRDDEPLPILRGVECYFESREYAGAPRSQDAVTVDGPARVELTNCAFAPHPALVHFLENKGQRGSVTLDHCSALLADGSAFQVDRGAWCEFRVWNSIFSSPRASSSALIQQDGDEPQNVRYQGQGNLYHNLAEYWTRGPFFFGENAWEAFRGELKQTGGKENSMPPLATSPWLDKDPLRTIQNGNPKLAFQVDLNRRELRQTDQPARLVGVEQCAWGPIYDGRLLPLEEKNPDRSKPPLIVDPTVPKPGDGVYRTLAQAVQDANPGDTILIKHARDNRIVPVDIVRLEKPDINLTIRPADGFHPILTLGKCTEPDASLFRLHDGKLTLEGLEFQLTADQTEFPSRAVVAVVGNGECRFSNCVATLDRGDNVANMGLALVTVIDPSKVMQMPGGPVRQNPDIYLDKCFVRGKGELVAVRASRPFGLHAENSLVVLDGNFLAVEGTANGQLLANPALVSLNRVTTFLTDHLVCLRGSQAAGGRGLIQTQVTPSDCLFASPEGKSSLVHLDNLDANLVPAGVRAFFSWNNAQNNVYSNYKEMLDQKPVDDGNMTPPAYDRVKWESFTTEARPRFNEPTYRPESSLTKVTPREFRINSPLDSGPYGADINELPTPYLPKPAEIGATGRQ